MSTLFISEPLTLQIDNLSSLEKSSPESCLEKQFFVIRIVFIPWFINYRLDPAP